LRIALQRPPLLIKRLLTVLIKPLTRMVPLRRRLIRTRLRLVLLRDGGLAADEEKADGEPAALEDRRADAVQELAERRGVRVSVVAAEGGSALERLASLVAVLDFASIYLGLAHGLDPMAVPAVSEMKELVSP